MSDPVRQALEAFNGGRADEAEGLLRARLADSPGDAAAHQLAAAIALRGGRAGDAARAAAASLAIRPRHAQTLTLAGDIAAVREGAGAAAVWFGRAVEADPEWPEPMFKLCLALLSAGDAAAAADPLAAALRRFPRAAAGWASVGQALAAAKDWEASGAAYRRAAGVSGLAAHWLGAGRALHALGRWGDALDAQRRALAADPGAPDPLLPMALTLRALGRPLEARAALERRSAMTPGDARADFLLGLVCEDLRDGPAAVAAYRRSVAHGPGNAESQLNLGLALQQAGDFDAALAAYRDAVRLRPDTFGRVAQALASKPHGRLWLRLRGLRDALGAGAPPPDAKALAIDAGPAEQGLRG